MKRFLALVGLAILIAIPVYLGMDWWKGRNLLAKVRERGVQTEGVVTKLSFSHVGWMGRTTYWVEYDYVAGGSKHHGRLGTRRSPAASEGEHIPVTYVRGEPDASLPFGTRDLALADDPTGKNEPALIAFLLSVALLLTPLWRLRRGRSRP